MKLLLIVDSVCRSRSITKDNGESTEQKEDSTDDMMSNVGDPINHKDKMTEKFVEKDVQSDSEEDASQPRDPEGTSGLSSTSGSNTIDYNKSNIPREIVPTPLYSLLSVNHSPLNKSGPIALYDINRCAGNINFPEVPGSVSGASASFIEDPFLSLASGTGNEAPWASFLSALDTSDINFNSWDGTESTSHNAFVPIPQSAQDHQSFLGENGQFVLPSQTANGENRLPHERLGESGSLAGAQSQPPCPANFTPLSASASWSPDAPTGHIELSSNLVAIQKVSKSGRSLIPSTRHEKMNEIGSNKENASVVVPLKSSSDWVEDAKKYLLGLEMGEDWKACVDGWAMVEGTGRSSKVR